MAKLNKQDQRWIYDYAIKEAGTVLHLLSDDSKFVTAQTLMVDGGTVAT